MPRVFVPGWLFQVLLRLLFNTNRRDAGFVYLTIAGVQVCSRG